MSTGAHNDAIRDDIITTLRAVSRFNDAADSLKNVLHKLQSGTREETQTMVARMESGKVSSSVWFTMSSSHSNLLQSKQTCICQVEMRGALSVSVISGGPGRDN